MSDPAKSTEIEDVLASIRKLVSVDPTPAMKARNGSGAQKLILTSDLRVGHTGTGPSDNDGPLVLNGAFDADEDTPGDDFSRDSKPAPAGESPLQGIALEIVTESSDARAARTKTAPVSDTLEARIAELEAAVSSQSADFEPDGSEDLRQHRPDRMPGGRGRGTQNDRIAENAATDIDTDQADDDAEALVAEFVSRNRRQTVQSDAPDAETIAAGSDRAGEPAPIRGYGDAVETPEPVEEGPGAPQGALDDDPGARGDGPASEDWAEAAEDGEADADLLDEAALRALVSEIVRSELQGALGERITRNVRKLVRREIMRAITVRDST